MFLWLILQHFCLTGVELVSRWILLFCLCVFCSEKSFVYNFFGFKKIYFPRILRKSWAGKSRANFTLVFRLKPNSNTKYRSDALTRKKLSLRQVVNHFATA